MKNFIIILSALFLMGLSVNAQITNTRTGKDTSNLTSSDAWDREKIEKFVTKAANSSLMEIQLGQYASQNATAAQVKEYGAMMVTDHTNASQQLKSAVSGMNITLPTSVDTDNQNKIDKLKNKTGKDFDKEYIDLMVKDHKNTIDDLQKAQKNVTDLTLKNWIDNTLPVLRQHLSRAESLQSQMK